MFQRKSHKVTVPAEGTAPVVVPSLETAQFTVSTVETNQVTLPAESEFAVSTTESPGAVPGHKSALIPAALSAAAAAKSKLGEQGGHGMAMAKPALVAAGAAVAPKLGEARERVEEEVLPRVADAREHVIEAKEQFVAETLPKLVEVISGALAAGAVAKSEAVAKLLDSEAAHRAGDAALVLKGEAVAQRPQEEKKRGFWSGLLTVLGVLAVAGGLAWFFNKRAAEQDDPWARPLADPYVPPTTGRESSAPAMGTVEGVAGSMGLVTDGPVPTGSATLGQFGDVADGDVTVTPGSDADAGDIRVIDPLEFEHTSDAAAEATTDTEEKKDF